MMGPSSRPSIDLMDTTTIWPSLTAMIVACLAIVGGFVAWRNWRRTGDGERRASGLSDFGARPSMFSGEVVATVLASVGVVAFLCALYAFVKFLSRHAG